MKGRPWYKRYPADILHGTMTLTIEEKGGYTVALDLMYDQGGPIPDDIKWLARMCGCSQQQWRAVRGRLIEKGKLSLTPDGRLSNGRAIYEMQRGAAEADSLRAAGRRGGQKTQRKQAENRAKPAHEASYASRFDPPSETPSEKSPTSGDINHLAEKGLDVVAPDAPTNDCDNATEKAQETSRFVGENIVGFSDEIARKQRVNEKRAASRLRDSDSQSLVPPESGTNNLGSPTGSTLLRNGDAAAPPSAVAPTDDVQTRLWNEGKAIVRHLTGKLDGQARSQVGAFLRDAKGDCSVVLDVLHAAEREGPHLPIPWIVAGIQSRLQPEPTYRMPANQIAEARGLNTKEARDEFARRLTVDHSAFGRDSHVR